jgi:TPP-dependent pyruvate/acetoin dehydrogenase alpha subunit
VEEAELDAIDEAIVAEFEEHLEVVKQAPMPAPENLCDNVYINY